MNIHFLGTAAAEGVPALFCYCEVCETARKEKGHNIRTRFQIAVNDDLLIDFPPDTYLHVLEQGLDLGRITDILITHSHEDHIFVPDMTYRMDGYCGKRPEGRINLYTNSEVHEKTELYLKSMNCVQAFDEVFRMETMELFQEYTVGSYTVYALLADHNPSEHCYFYIVRDRAGKAALFAHDTGYFPQKSWEFLQHLDLQFDVVSLDCTCGFLDSDRIHMGMSCCAKVKQRLADMKRTHDKTVFIANHFSHNGLRGNDKELEAYADRYGFIPAYDGLRLEV